MNHLSLLALGTVLLTGMFNSALAQTPKEFKDQEAIAEKFFKAYNKDDAKGAFEDYIADFKKLPVPARLMCIRNFPKFAELSAAERQQFLSNAQEWQKMSSDDRETWRKLVGKVPRLPPLPPGLGRPPLPKLATKSSVVTAEETNR